MRLPTRKPGKYNGLKPDPYLTLKKYKELQNKLARLKKFSQPRAISEVKRLALDGDFSENAAYSMAKGRLRGINQKILEIEEYLKKAIIIKPGGNQKIVSLGSRVKVLVNGKQKIYQILGSSETNPAEGIISRNSPIGRALIGHKTGETVKIKLANGQTEYKIISLN